MIWSDEALSAELDYRREVLRRSAAVSRRGPSKAAGAGLGAALRHLWSPARANRHPAAK